ncbi:hypothetical protein OIDMADRAFT_54369 [Oidiodendron maius Zn]|uniref:Reverse transcriptase Ty1/copia-type domain-containing protein n=1 Tax=Oidiodendron maius (strain Zn) TaxID=913774 RepID=A0A0C3GZ30_OIDMZ|nr:hypothetical protein OIDMADRAFT_54369 [Oidiodendron maius Zn]
MTSNNNLDFGIVGIQTDNTLILCNDTFTINKINKLKKAQFLSKERELLTQLYPLKFNGSNITLKKEGSIALIQERQYKNLQLVAIYTTDLANARGAIYKAVTPKDQYIIQRTRGAYITTVLQPEAVFDLSFTIQVINLKKEHIKQLNKRLQ